MAPNQEATMNALNETETILDEYKDFILPTSWCENLTQIPKESLVNMDKVLNVSTDKTSFDFGKFF